MAQVGGGGGAQNLLTRVNPADFDPSTNEVNIGSGTGTYGVESMAFRESTTTLYAANYDHLGILDLTTGLFAPLSEPFGTGFGSEGWQSFSDIDGISFHPSSGVLYGSVRRDGANDLLIQIDIATGAHIPGAFGGDDYVVVYITNLPTHADVDDITFEPVDDTLYAIGNQRGNRDYLMTIDIATGVGSEISNLSYQGVAVQDMEGLSFGCNGVLYGTTGWLADPPHKNRLWDIDKITAAVSSPRVLDNGRDYEAAACGCIPPPPPTPIPTPMRVIMEQGDYDGDGTSDIAVYRPGSGMWAVRDVTRFYYGAATDIPVPGDYDGDGTTDLGIFRNSSRMWAVSGVTRTYYGAAGDIPVPMDYNGDGTTDISVYRGSSGMWSSKGLGRIYFGLWLDVPVPGDYDGDGTADAAIFRGLSGMWAIRDISRVHFGGSNDRLVPGDYDGDGFWEVAIFRPTSGMWAVSGVTRVYYGASSDAPVPADYNGNSVDDVGIFRPTSGMWAVKDGARTYYGGPNDVPVTR